MSDDLITTWTKAMSGQLDLARLNELISHYKAISKSEPKRSTVWRMVVEKAEQLGFEFDRAKLAFAPRRR